MYLNILVGVFIFDIEPASKIGEQIVEQLYPGATEKHKEVMKGNPVSFIDIFDM